MTPTAPDRSSRSADSSGLVARAARRLVRVILRAHPREFQRRYRDDVLAAIDEDLRDAASIDAAATRRAAARAVADAMTSLAAAPGSVLTFHEEHRSMRTWWRDALTDVRLGFRHFRREPAWCAAVVVTLALGVGVNAAMFGVADRLLLSGPEHVHDAARIRRLQITRQRPGQDVQRDGTFPYAAYQALKGPGRSFAAVAGYAVYTDGAVLGRGADARRINYGEATADFFPLLGVTPVAGRFFTSAEDDVVAPQPVVILGFELWQSAFGGRADAVGQSLVLDNKPYTVIGVAPKDFTGADLTRVDAWFPESLLGSTRIRPNWTQSWNSWWMSIVVRLAPGVGDDQADAEATERFRAAAPESNQPLRQASLAVRPLTDGRDGSPSMEARISTWLSAVAGVVLLVSCANVMNLVLARALRRRREVAVRQALGAGRGRLIRLLLAEALTLALGGAGVGVGVAYVVGTLMRTWLLPGLAWPTGVVNTRMLVVSLAAALAAGLLIGLLPAWRARAPDVSASLKTGTREGGGKRQRARSALTILQAALCALLLVGSGLFVVSLSRVRAMDLGIQPDRVVTIGIRRAGLPSAATDAQQQQERDRRNAFYPMALDRFRARPDVEGAALTIGLPFWMGFGEDIRVPGVDHLPQLKGGGPYLNAVTADYFRVVGTPILRGRAFTTADHAGTAPVAIVNGTMARAVWPGKDALGQCFFIEKETSCTEVIGIAADARRFKLEESEALAFYIPFGQEQGVGGTTLIVRPRGAIAPALSAIRQDLFSLDPSITYVDAKVLQDQVEPQIRPWELGATMFTLMGVLALLVAAVGLYSVMSYVVADRTHEIGLRMALGARPADVARLVIRGGLLLAIGGITLGFGLAILAGRLIEPLLFHTSPRDPAVFAEVAAVLVGMAMVATVVPAARARRINPVEAMREE